MTYGYRTFRRQPAPRTFGGGFLHAPQGAFLERAELEAFPTLFANTAHDSRSEKFEVIPTIDMLDWLADEGFGVTSVRVGRTRDSSKVGFTKHWLTLRHRDHIKPRHELDATVPELSFRNGNDGTSGYWLDAYLKRLICLNGMTVSCAMEGMQPVRVRHTGRDIQARVIEGTYEVIANSQRALEIEPMRRAAIMPQELRLAYADAILALRYGNGDAADAVEETEGLPALPADDSWRVKAPATAQQMLTARRHEDRGNDQWHTQQVLEENALRGMNADRATGTPRNWNLQRIVTGDTGRQRRASVRAVNSIEGNLNLQRQMALFAAHVDAQMARMSNLAQI